MTPAKTSDRPLGLLALLGASALLGVANGARQLAENDSAVDRPLGLLSLAVGIISIAAAAGVWRRARWAYRAVVLWAVAIVVAGVAGSVLLRRYMPHARDLVPGPVALTVLAWLAVRRARRRLPSRGVGRPG